MNYGVFESFPNLTTQRLTLQLHKESDVDDLFILRSDPEVMMFMDKPAASDKLVILQRIKEIRQDFKDRKGINWTIKFKNSDEAIGYMSLWKIDHANHRAELGYALKKEYWKKGIALEAAKKVIDFGFNELKVHSIMANINPKNSASEVLLSRLGFIKEAHFREDFYFKGKFLDSAIFSLLQSDWK
jgi:ribosomal-protein-alanine N-acetyltransferase